MFDKDLLFLLKDFSALGTLALVIVIEGIVALKGISLIKDKVIPLVTNHLVHIDKNYEELASAMRDHNALTRGVQELLRNQSTLIESHGQLLRRDIELDE